MKRMFIKGLVSLLLCVVFTTSFADDGHIVYGLKKAEEYKGHTNHTFFIQTRYFSSFSKASKYKTVLRSKTNYPVQLFHEKNAYAIMIGPIESAAKMRETAATLLSHAGKKTSLAQASLQPKLKQVATQAPAMTSASSPLSQPVIPVSHKIDPPVKQNMVSVDKHRTTSDVRDHWYLSIGGGVQYPSINATNTINNSSGFPPPNNHDLYSFKNDNRPVFTLEGGYRFERENQWFPAYSVGAFYEYLLENDVGGTIMQYSAPAFTNYTFNWSISSSILLASAKVDLFNYQHIMPYVNAGIGGAMIRASSYNETAYPGVTARTSAGYEDKSTIQLAYNIGLGIDYQLNKNLILSAGYEYLNLGSITSGVGSGSWAGQSLNLGSYHSNEALLSMTYLIDHQS